MRKGRREAVAVASKMGRCNLCGGEFATTKEANLHAYKEHGKRMAEILALPKKDRALADKNLLYLVHIVFYSA